MAEKVTRVRTFRFVVLALGTLVALCFLLAFVPSLISVLRRTAPNPQTGREWEGQIMIAMLIVFLIGYAIGWWKILWGGIIMILASLLVSIPFIILDNNYGSLIFAIPLFVIGFLYYSVYRFEKRERG